MVLGLVPAALPKGIPMDGSAHLVCKPGAEMKAYLATFLEQILNSAIVAGITALSTISASFTVNAKAVGIAFGLTFLIEMRKYRKTNS
jgi:hypothetical protein